MGESSKIEWTDHTFNPWYGCQHVSPGCDHCYAEEMMDKRFGRVQWGPHGARVRGSETLRKEPLRWAKRAVNMAHRPRVFCASLADWLDNKVPDTWRDELATIIEDTPQLDWLLLTKRIENFDRHSPWRADAVPSNVWLGITAENQECYARRWPILADIAAPVRFVSYEPALGDLNLRVFDGRPDWVICGGESGHFARPFHANWARAVRDDCAASGAAFFMKQMGGRIRPFPPIPPDLDVREFPTPRLARCEPMED